MSDRNSEDIIGALYDMVQDARSMPLAADKCILERDKVLDMLDEIIAQLPAELKQSRTIEQLRKAGNAYMDDSLRQTEEVVSKALAEIRETRMKFRTVTEAQQRKTPNVDVEV